MAEGRLGAGEQEPCCPPPQEEQLGRAPTWQAAAREEHRPDCHEIHSRVLEHSEFPSCRVLRAFLLSLFSAGLSTCPSAAGHACCDHAWPRWALGLAQCPPCHLHLPLPPSQGANSNLPYQARTEARQEHRALLWPLPLGACWPGTARPSDSHHCVHRIPRGHAGGVAQGPGHTGRTRWVASVLCTSKWLSSSGPAHTLTTGPGTPCSCIFEKCLTRPFLSVPTLGFRPGGVAHVWGLRRDAKSEASAAGWILSPGIERAGEVAQG